MAQPRDSVKTVCCASRNRPIFSQAVTPGAVNWFTLRELAIKHLLLFLCLSACAAGSANHAVPLQSDIYRDADEWRASVPKKLRPRPAFAFVEANAALPNVLLVGDSVSMSYTAEVRDCLIDIANVYRVPRNARSTAYTIARLDQFLGKNAWDVIVFNWGLHDLTMMDRNGKPAPPPDGKHQVPLQDYRNNLELLTERLAAAGTRLVWATTTPIGPKTERRGFRRNQDVDRYNRVAADLMRANDIEILDLNAVIARRDDWHQTDGLHFDTMGQRLLADAVAGRLKTVLPEQANKIGSCEPAADDT